MLPIKFIISWSFGPAEEEEEEKKKQKKKKKKKKKKQGGHFGLPIGTILVFYELQVTPILPSNFQDGGHWGHLGFTKKKPILAIFDVQVSALR